jgi:hypothetical protein
MFMSKAIVAVDPAKRLHRAVAVWFADEILLNVASPNAIDAVETLDTRLADLASTNGAELVYGLEDHRRYGRLFCQVVTRRGRDVRGSSILCGPTGSTRFAEPHR